MMKLNRKFFAFVFILLLVVLVSFLFFKSEEYQDVTLSDLHSNAADFLGLKIKTGGVVKYYNATGILDFIAGDFFVRLPSGMIGIPVFVVGKQQLPSEGSFVEVLGNPHLGLGPAGQLLYFTADSWHYVPAFNEYIREVAYIMTPLTAFFLVFLIAKSFGGLLGYLHIGHGKHVE